MLAHTNWGLTFSSLSTIHKSLILSKLEYNSFLIINGNKNALNMLETIYNAAPRLATGAFRSNPIPSILNISNVIPLHVKCQEIAMMLAIKLTRNFMISTVQSCPSIQSIVDENNLNLKDIITSQTPFFPGLRSLIWLILV